MTPPPPLVKWAQRPSLVILTICLEDCKDPKIDVKPDYLQFEGNGGPDKKDHELKMEFLKEIDPEKIAKDLIPMMDAVQKYNVPVQFPTAWSQFPGALYYGNPIWADEVAARYPDVPVILTKMGRSMITYYEPCLTVAMRNENVYFDVVGTNSEHLRHAIDHIGSERILFGSDWSATWSCVREPAPLYDIRKKVIDDANCSDEERKNILWRNAARLFKLDEMMN